MGIQVIEDTKKLLIEALVNVEGEVVEFSVCVEIVADVHLFDSSGIDRYVRRSAQIDGVSEFGVQEVGIYCSGDHQC